MIQTRKTGSLKNSGKIPTVILRLSENQNSFLVLKNQRESQVKSWNFQFEMFGHISAFDRNVDSPPNFTKIFKLKKISLIFGP